MGFESLSGAREVTDTVLIRFRHSTSSRQYFSRDLCEYNRILNQAGILNERSRTTLSFSFNLLVLFKSTSGYSTFLMLWKSLLMIIFKIKRPQKMLCRRETSGKNTNKNNVFISTQIINNMIF